MPIIKAVRGKHPQMGENCFIAENATIVGEVSMGDDCSVWFQTVIRGDVNSITIGNKVNIQDGAVIHATYQKAPTVIGNSVSIGHRAIVHGCTLKDNVLYEWQFSQVFCHGLMSSKTDIIFVLSYQFLLLQNR